MESVNKISLNKFKKLFKETYGTPNPWTDPDYPESEPEEMNMMEHLEMCTCYPQYVNFHLIGEFLSAKEYSAIGSRIIKYHYENQKDYDVFINYWKKYWIEKYDEIVGKKNSA